MKMTVQRFDAELSESGILNNPEKLVRNDSGYYMLYSDHEKHLVKVWEMLQEAKAKLKDANERLDYQHTILFSDEIKEDIACAKAEVSAFRAVLGSDEVRLDLLANKG